MHSRIIWDRRSALVKCQRDSLVVERRGPSATGMGLLRNLILWSHAPYCSQVLIHPVHPLLIVFALFSTHRLLDSNAHIVRSVLCIGTCRHAVRILAAVDLDPAHFTTVQRGDGNETHCLVFACNGVSSCVLDVWRIEKSSEIHPRQM